MLQIESYQPETDTKGAALFRVTNEDEKITYENIYAWNDDRELRSGAITLSNNDAVIMAINYSDYEKVKIGRRNYILGDFVMTLDEGMASGSLKYQASREGERVNMVIGIQDIIEMRIGYQEISPADVTFPSYSPDQLVNITDYQALAGLLDENALSELMRIAQQLGLIPQGDGE